jgi:hypothetical protein
MNRISLFFGDAKMDREYFINQLSWTPIWALILGMGIIVMLIFSINGFNL